MLDIQLGGGEGELLDGGDLLREGADPLGVQRVTQEGHGGLGQDALLQVDGEAVLLEPFVLFCVKKNLNTCEVSAKSVGGFPFFSGLGSLRSPLGGPVLQSRVPYWTHCC